MKDSNKVDIYIYIYKNLDYIMVILAVCAYKQ